jgi:phage repressor protein C with HTH and peptisase S24 domain
MAREIILPPNASLLQRGLYEMLRKKRGVRAAKTVSVEAGLGETAVRDIIVGRSKRPSWKQLSAIAAVLGCSVDELSVNAGPEDLPYLGGEARPGPALARYPDPRRDLIPIRSAGRGGEEQQMYSDDPLGHTPRPASLIGIRDAYSIYMVGESMIPRYEPGWLLYVNPIIPRKKGRAVVVIKNDKAVLVKIFIGERNGNLVLKQLNPRGSPEILIPLGEVAEVHVVTGSEEAPVIAAEVG